MNIAVTDDELGYFEDGEPTNAQIELQDQIDSLIEEFVENMRRIYNSATYQHTPVFEHDIKKITAIRETFEVEYGLPDIY
jgi:hypothetical protein